MSIARNLPQPQRWETAKTIVGGLGVLGGLGLTFALVWVIGG